MGKAVRLSAEMLIADLRAVAASLGRTPRRLEMEILSTQRRAYSPTAFKDRFGSWSAAVAAAGLPTRRISPGRARKAKAGLRFRVLLRDGFRCVYCGHGPEDGARLVLDHVIPYSKGGLTLASNLRTACHDCNIGKHASLIEMEEQIKQ